jgi:hypothetical protein
MSWNSGATVSRDHEVGIVLRNSPLRWGKVLRNTASRCPYLLGTDRWGTYEFGNLLSADARATATNVRTEVTCTLYSQLLPPYAQPQRIIVVYEYDWSFSQLLLHFTPPAEESSDCFWDEQRVGRPKPSDGVSTMTVDCTGSGGDSPNGSTGTETWCLFYDTYDLSGNLLYSVAVSCWEE